MNEIPFSALEVERPLEGRIFLMAWQCSPKFEEALEEMSGWFKDAGEVESKADSRDFARGVLSAKDPCSLPEEPDTYGEDLDLEADPHPELEEGEKEEEEEKKPETSGKAANQEFNQARDVANSIYSTAKAVLEQSHQEFLQLLTNMDRNSEGHAGQGLLDGHSSMETLSHVSTTDAGTSLDSDRQSETSAPDAKHWKRSLKTSKKGSSRSSTLSCPMSPGLVTRASCCFYGKQEKLQEKRYENPEDKSPAGLDKISNIGKVDKNEQNDKIDKIDKIDKTKLSFAKLKEMNTIKVKKSAGKARSVAGSVASDESKVTSQKEVGRVRLRITPQHFSPLGTRFRDVHVDFLTTSFTIRALDCEGYAWTALSNELPARLAVNRCRYKLNPNGKDVVISLCGADEDQSWKGMTRLELARPYTVQQGDKEEGPQNSAATKLKSTWTPNNLKNNFI